MNTAYPLCFNSKIEFDLWMAASRLSRTGLSGYCEDCTPEYQCAMVKDGRCAFHDTHFAVDDGIVVGVRSKDAISRAKKGGAG
jgi:hypothetical protein